MGLKKEYTGALFPIEDIGTFGCYAQVFSPGKFENARDIDEQPSKPSMLELALGASYARAFLDQRVSFGVSAAYIESRLDHEAGRALAGSIDLLATPVKMLSARLYMANLEQVSPMEPSPNHSLQEDYHCLFALTILLSHNLQIRF